MYLMSWLLTSMFIEQSDRGLLLHCLLSHFLLLFGLRCMSTPPCSAAIFSGGTILCYLLLVTEPFQNE